MLSLNFSKKRRRESGSGSAAIKKSKINNRNVDGSFKLFVEEFSKRLSRYFFSSNKLSMRDAMLKFNAPEI